MPCSGTKLAADRRIPRAKDLRWGKGVAALRRTGVSPSFRSALERGSRLRALIPQCRECGRPHAVQGEYLLLRIAEGRTIIDAGALEGAPRWGIQRRKQPSAGRRAASHAGQVGQSVLLKYSCPLTQVRFVGAPISCPLRAGGPPCALRRYRLSTPTPLDRRDDHDQTSDLYDELRKRVSALCHQGGAEGSIKGGGRRDHPLADRSLPG